MNNKLLFFGCSFTSLETSPTGANFENYRFKVSNYINTSHICNAKTGHSNLHIIDDVYNCSNDINNTDDIFVIQYSFFERLGMRADITDDKFVSMCKKNIDDTSDWREVKQIDFYNDWLKYFYSIKGSIVEFEKEVNLISNWLNSKNIKFVSIGFDPYMDKFSENFYETNNFVKFDETYSMYKKSVNDKLRIEDLGLSKTIIDNHLSEEGHEYLSNKIIDKFKKIKYIKDSRSIL
jgi:hypothetical protein